MGCDFSSPDTFTHRLLKAVFHKNHATKFYNALVTYGRTHFPSGTSKWNKIEHRMFCYISKNWQGQPLVDIETVINLISSTTKKTGLKIICMPDYNKYELGRTVSDEEFFALPIKYLNDLGKRNYVIKAAKD